MVEGSQPRWPMPEKILIVRNDRVGDFMLAWPAMSLIKSHLRDHEVHALVPEYTLELAELCPYVDRVIVDPGSEGGVTALLRILKAQRYSAAVCLYSTARVGAAVWLARIPMRTAPATKLAQIFYNHRLTQRRSRSLKPEYEYNTDLARYTLNRFGIEAGEVRGPPYLVFDKHEIQDLRRTLMSRFKIPANKRLVFMHPGSGGSARNLSLDQYARLASRLQSGNGHCIVITAGPGERHAAESLGDSLSDVAHVVFESKQGLANFARHIACADLFISGSTGPLHIAGGLDRPTVGFYPNRRSATALRWQTLNQAARRLAFTPALDSHDENMQAIDIDTAANEISRTF